MDPQIFVSLPIPLPPLSTLLPSSKLRLNPVFTLSSIFPISPMVMSPRYPLPFASHPPPPSVPPLLPLLFCLLFLPFQPNPPIPFFNVCVLLLPCPVGR